MSPIRILVVDDDLISRKLLRAVLEKASDIEVVGVASNGEIGLSKIHLLRPDLVTLDVEMPVMGGLETLRKIKRRWPDLPVIMYSALTEADASVTLDALELGASDYVTKPEGRTLDGFPLDRLREEILPKVRALCSPAKQPEPGAGRIPEHALKPVVPARRAKTPIDILTIGVSTGGPNALAELVPGLAPDLAVPTVIVQHMPATFTRLLAERLDKNTALRVVEATEDEPLLPGTIYIAPGGYHMLLKHSKKRIVVGLTQDPKVNSCRPAVDVLFKSVAEEFGANTLNVILTGMGADGREGCRALEQAGGSVLIQDEASSVVWGMPGSIARAGIPHTEYPLSKIAIEINNRVTAAGQSTTWQAKSA